MVGDKETKARQGMKIMGLQDTTYFLAYTIQFLYLALWNAIWQVLFLGQILDKFSSLTLFFFLFLFSTSLYGMALFIQSLVNTQKAANGLSIVIFFLCQQLNTPFANNPPAEGVLYLISVFPPIVMMRMIKLMFIY